LPDNVLTPLIRGIAADNYFLSVGATLEDEAVGTATGAYMACLRSAVMMQTSGFASPNFASALINTTPAPCRSRQIV
jgi:sulfopyruvate decarboxylase TPP-binding subunit